MLTEFTEKYDIVIGQLNDLNKQKMRGIDISLVKVSFMKLCDEVNNLWLELTEEEKNEFEIGNKG